MNKAKTIFLLLLISANVFAQLPNTDIWLMDLPRMDHSSRIGEAVNITKRDGYDNQPVFSPDDKCILYTSVRNNRSDIYKYDLSTEKISQFTNTPNTSEYSPAFMPGKKGISVVMVEADDSTQRIWKFPATGGDKPSVLLADFDSVGYYCWFYGGRAAIFMLTEPSTLQLIDKTHARPLFIDDSIGRCMKYYDGMLYYTKKRANDKNELYCFNLPGWNTHSTGTIIESEDFVIYDRKVVYGKGSRIFTCELYNGEKQTEITDLGAYGIKSISRLAISGDGYMIAFAAEK
jgi:Tol biopolymer transport system component